MTEIASAARGAILTLACLASLTACDGPNEKAGRDADRAEAAAMGENVTGEGPRERLGEAQDRVEKADARASDAAAEALEKQGDQLRTQADFEADQLDEQARGLRDRKTQATQ
ncbi:MAG: hypothetical protein ACOY5R_14325 [Pseudomonadota bacterium]|uniref:hypothetical protein n=1 Tax=Rhizorhabdus phycosphaerae TaxID=2711156 RepID=UPI0013EBF641|nr:hypothetical protein [Rhizorhabdus phycosphaerae]